MWENRTKSPLDIMLAGLILNAVPKLQAVVLIGLAFSLAGCSGENGLTVGSDRDAEPNGSYSGSTLNSPVTDQNPHPGGDPSYPSSVSDQGVTPPPPDKTDGR
jgi:hypothetical protein